MPRYALTTAVAALVATAPALAQNAAAHPPAPTSFFSRDDILETLQRERVNTLAYVDAMPDSAMTFRPTPGVRTFAQQIDHLVSSNVAVAVGTLHVGSAFPVLGDTAAYFRHKAALRAYVAASYDYTANAVLSAAPDDLTQAHSLFRQPPAPTWRWFLMSHEHATWTLGQTVPYLRLNHVTPPAYQLPF